LGPTSWVALPLGYKPPARDTVDDTVYWDTLAPRITEFGCRSVVSYGPASPDKARIPHLRQIGEAAKHLTSDSQGSAALPA